MRRSALFLPLPFLALAGCVQSNEKYPSLLPRAIESQGTAEPVRTAPVATPDPTLDARIATLTTELDKAQKDFTSAAQDTEAKIAVARGLAEGSEPWINAQVALAGLDVLRGRTADVLDALEQLAIERGRAGEPPYPALNATIARAAALSEDQGKRIRSLESAL
jgi:hypothetical protein